MEASVAASRSIRCSSVSWSAYRCATACPSAGASRVASAYVEPRDPAATGLIPSCEWFHLPTAWTHRGQISNQSSERPSMNLDRWKLLLPLPLFGLASCAMPAVQNAIPDVAAPAATC